MSALADSLAVRSGAGSGPGLESEPEPGAEQGPGPRSAPGSELASGPGSGLGERLDQVRTDERRRALRALLMQPLLHADHPAYPLVKRHIDWLRGWLARETRWDLRLESDFARLAKTAPEGDDGSRAARPGQRPADLPFTRRRYALLCLVLAALERGEHQTTLGRLGKAAIDQSGDPRILGAGLAFELRTQDERRDLVAVVRLLLDLGVLARVAGNEDAYIKNSERDVLYDIERRILASLLVTRRGPSLAIALEPVPRTLAERIQAIGARFVADTPEARNRELRQRLTERLLDDPVLYLADLDPDARAYLLNQRHAIVARIHEATGLVPEIRAEGIAMVDPSGDLGDLALPSEGTEGHIALLLADLLAQRLRDGAGDGSGSGTGEPAVPLAWQEIAAAYARWQARHGRYWKKAAKEPGAAATLTREAAARLAALGLARIEPEGVRPLPAVARYACSAPRIAKSAGQGD